METPVPIPNTVVKRSCGDDSPNWAKVASRQDREFNRGLISSFDCETIITDR
jgi:hypothetical protein